MTWKNVSGMKVTVVSVLKYVLCQSVCVWNAGRKWNNFDELSEGPETDLPYLKSSSTSCVW